MLGSFLKMTYILGMKKLIKSNKYKTTKLVFFLLVKKWITAMLKYIMEIIVPIKYY